MNVGRQKENENRSENPLGDIAQIKFEPGDQGGPSLVGLQNLRGCGGSHRRLRGLGVSLRVFFVGFCRLQGVTPGLAN